MHFVCIPFDVFIKGETPQYGMVNGVKKKTLLAIAIYSSTKEYRVHISYFSSPKEARQQDNGIEIRKSRGQRDERR